MLSKTVSICSILLVLCQGSFGTDYVALRQNFESATSNETRLRVLGTALDQNPDLDNVDHSLYKQLSEAANEDQITSAKIKSIDRMLDARVAAMSTAAKVDPSIEQLVKEIKSSPLYHDSGTGASANWLAKAFERLQDLFRFNPSHSNPRPDLPTSGGFDLIFVIFCVSLLGLAFLTFLYLAVKHFSWQKTLRRKASALLEEDEPERSADEWLGLADGLTQQGRFREAVRCLYLACLLRFDEAGIARFNRSETNWEHLSRIQASPNRPPELDFLPPTQFFDRIWYGHQVRGQEDIDQFRIWYGNIMQMLRKVAA